MDVDDRATDTAVEQHPVGALLVRCLDAIATSGPSAVENILESCGEHANAVRERLQILEDLGLASNQHHAQPQKLGEFRLLRRLAGGSQGVIWLAEQESLGRRVALKVLRPGFFESAHARARLEREARLIAKLDHPNIVSVIGTGQDDGLTWVAMEYVDGQSLDEVLDACRQGPKDVPLSQFLVWGREIGRALACAHGQGIVHRDVKPANIRITAKGHAKLLDFGLARDDDCATLTVSNTFQGSPVYAAPEQVRSDGAAIGPSTDIYGLGMTLYECFTGEIAFRGRTTEQVFDSILHTEPRRLRRICSTIPVDIEKVVLKAIEKDPSARYASASDMAEDLDAVLHFRPVRANLPGPVRRVTKAIRRNRTAFFASLSAAFLVLAAAIAFGFYLDARRKVPARVAQHLRHARLALLDTNIGELMHTVALRDSQVVPIRFDARAALAEYDAALALDPSRRDIRDERDIVQLAREMSSQPTIEQIERAVPEDERARGLLALLLGHGRYTMQCWQSSGMSLEDPDPLVDLALGEMYLALDRPERAYPRLFLAQAQFPETGFVAVDLADAACRNGEPKLAEHYLRVAAELEDRDPYGSDRRVAADVAAALGQVERAEDLYRDVIDKSQAPTAIDHCARLFADQGRLRESLRVRTMLWRSSRFDAPLFELLEHAMSTMPIAARMVAIRRACIENEYWRPGLIRALESRVQDGRNPTAASTGRSWMHSLTPVLDQLNADRHVWREVPPFVLDLLLAATLKLGHEASDSGPRMRGLGQSLRSAAQLLARFGLARSPPSDDGRMAYDPVQRCAVYFGHYRTDVHNDFWRFDGQRWRQIFSSPTPPARRWHAMVTDAARQRIVLFGGMSTHALGDTWEWDGKRWTEMKPSSSPSPRFHHAMAFDARRNRVVLFGGIKNAMIVDDPTESGPSAETWEWDGANWLQCRPSQAPRARRGHAMAFDDRRGVSLLLGGWSPTDRTVSNREVWTWDGHHWKDLTPTELGLPVIGNAAAYDPARHRVVVLHDEGPSVRHLPAWDRLLPSMTKTKSIAYEWDGSRWHRSKGPPGYFRWSYGMTYDAARGTLLVLGGRDDSGSVNRTWRRGAENRWHGAR